MTDTRSGPDADRFFDGIAGQATLGVAYLLVGVGLFAGIVLDSMALFVAALGGTLAVVAVSLYVAYTREGLLTAENRLVGVFVLLAMGLLVALYGFTDLPSEVVVGAVIVVGVLVPTFLLEHTALGRDD